ncbi:MAG: DinB family protein [Chloroflexi bacterium]|nr:DinB family protein [Chloroflexota bacterium]MCI0576495.1 DinB family protein [Chloroflexota bacterium]MCI0650217.1 DinB family protein [Chloroflexota bacterium]MCI0729395.1 DinB family protein [Chloroflexota bacterium]
MQAPPPVPTLLNQLATLAANVHGALAAEGVDWAYRPEPDQWSLTEVLCHLRDVEREVHQSRFRALLRAEHAFLPGVTADEWAEERGYRRQNGPAALADFLAARQETLRLLKDLDDSLWQRQGQHAFFGPTSMHELLYLVARHDELHWEQIKALLHREIGD